MVSTRSRRNKAVAKTSSEKHKASKKILKPVPKPLSKASSKASSKNQKPVPKTSASKVLKVAKTTKPQAAKANPSLSRSKQSSTPKFSSKSATTKAAPVKASPASSSKYPQYSSTQLASFKKHQVDLDSKKLPELKDMCRKNQMKVSGTKTELLERIADAMVLGVIPKCPHCGGGRPKLDPKTMTYHCAGYRDDIDFVNCHKTIPYSSLPRDPWQD